MTLFRDDLLRWQALPAGLVHGGSLRLALVGATEDGITADPGLCMHLLDHMAALGLRTERSTAGAICGALGPERLHALLRALALRKLTEDETAAPAALREQALLRACLARELARSIRYSEPEEAFLCALVMNAGEWLRTDGAGAAQAEIGQSLLQRWGLPPAALDALRYRNLGWNQLSGAHPLTVVLRLAEEISAGRVGDSLENPTLVELRSRAGDSARLLLGTRDEPPSADEAYAAFGPAGPEAWAATLSAFQAWFGAHPLLLFRLDEDTGLLHAVAAPAAAQDLRLPLDPQSSIVGRALGEARVLASGTGGTTPTLADEQMARILRRPGLLCVPMLGATARGVMVIGTEAREAAAFRDRSDALLLFARRSATLLGPAVRPAETAAPVESGALVPGIREVLHEAAAPMTTLRNYLHVLRQRDGAGDELRIMAEELERLQGILRQLDPRQTLGSVREDDLNRLVRDVLDSLRVDPLAQARKLASDLDPALQPLSLDAGALKQVLINLCRNSLEALPPGGQLRVATRDGINVDGCESLLIEVSDDGPGIPAAERARLFEPKTSRKPGHSGLGLSIVRRLVRELGGSISCQSGPGGTRFQILLPRSAAPSHDSPEH